MSRFLAVAFACAGLIAPPIVRGDIVTDWNATLNSVILATPEKHNPGNSTRGMAMLNAAIYDVFQAIHRTHTPFKVNLHAPDASLDAAVAQAAYRNISDTYGEQQVMLDGVLATRLAAIPDGPAKTAGIHLGNTIGQHYVDTHANDGHSLPDAYIPTVGAGHWSSDPLVTPEQKGWGSDWGFVTPWAMPDSDHFDSAITPPDMHSGRYAEAFDQVKEYGALHSAVRTAEQTAIGLFWAYDRPGIGPPPVLFVENLIDIANQAGNTPGDNARLFALATVAQADAAIAAWDVKYEADFWRPITAIRGAADDGNPHTIEDPNWVYLGAPGDDPNRSDDDFTPPFPAYTSGHATMGGALFKAVELFYGTNDFGLADSLIGDDPISSEFVLHSNEAGSGGARNYVRFTQEGPLDIGLENSPEGENGTSRVYLGIHWMFDQTDGIALGNAIATYAGTHYFQAVPELGTMTLMLLAAAVAVPMRWKHAVAVKHCPDLSKLLPVNG